MKLRTLLVGAVAGLLLTACGGGTSPKDVTNSFVNALAEGKCEDAKAMTVETATDNVQGSIDAGCASYKTEIVSTECTESGETANCTCKEKRDGMEMTYKYDLKKVDGAWKISAYQKDLGMDM